MPASFRGLKVGSPTSLDELTGSVSMIRTIRYDPRKPQEGSEVRFKEGDITVQWVPSGSYPNRSSSTS